MCSRSIVNADNQHLFVEQHALVVKRSKDLPAAFETAFDASIVATLC